MTTRVTACHGRHPKLQRLLHAAPEGAGRARSTSCRTAWSTRTTGPSGPPRSNPNPPIEHPAPPRRSGPRGARPPEARNRQAGQPKGEHAHRHPAVLQ